MHLGQHLNQALLESRVVHGLPVRLPAQEDRQSLSELLCRLVPLLAFDINLSDLKPIETRTSVTTSPV